MPNDSIGRDRGRTFHEIGRTQLERLWWAIHQRAVPSSVARVFDLFVPVDLTLHGQGSWRSFVGDDHTPYEFSLLLGDAEPEVRLMAEVMPAGKDVTLVDTIASGRNVLRILGEEFDTDTSRLDRIADLFLPDNPKGAFGLWLAARFDGAGIPSFKVYLNPNIRGVAESPHLVEEMLSRLGFRGAWSTVTKTFVRGRDDLRFVSLDLATKARGGSPLATPDMRSEAASGADDPERVKVYAFHRDAPSDALARSIGEALGNDARGVATFARMLAGGDGALSGPIQPGTCLSFVAGEATPRTVTLHVPVRSFADNDATAHARLLSALSELDIDAAPYVRAVEALATRPLETTSGLIAWGGIRSSKRGAKHVNIYLAPRALEHPGPHAMRIPSVPNDSLEALVRRHEREPLTLHPLLRRIAREPVDLRVMTMLLHNVGHAITRPFTRRLASLVARVEEDSIRTILAKQLNDELGNGDATRTHKVLFERFLTGLEPWAPPPGDDRWLEPGRALSAVQEDLFVQRSPYEGLGAALIMEVYGKQFDIFMGEQFRRLRDQGKDAIPAPVFEWLAIHEELEHEHVDESVELARRVPAGAKAKLALRGAREVADAGWAFLDTVYELTCGR